MNDVCLKFVSVGTGNAARRIAVRVREGAGPGLLWLGGFNSDMRGIKAQALDLQPVEITIPAEFRKNKRVYIGKEAVGLEFLHERVRQALTGQQNPDVTLAMDGSVTAQEFLNVIDRLKEGGVRNVGLKSQPPVTRVP